jgi:hypothetical protein
MRLADEEAALAKAKVPLILLQSIAVLCIHPILREGVQTRLKGILTGRSRQGFKRAHP